MPSASVGDEREIATLLVAVGLGLSGVTLALALDGPALVAAWSAEAAILAWVARRRTNSAPRSSPARSSSSPSCTRSPTRRRPRRSSRAWPTSRRRSPPFCASVSRPHHGPPRRGHGPADVPRCPQAALLYAASLAIVDVIQGDAEERSQTAQVALSAFWAIVGLAAIVTGLVRDLSELRFGGLALLGLGVAKIFLYDLAELDQLYRVLSLVAIGLVLLAGAYAYQRVRAAGRIVSLPAILAVTLAAVAADVDETQFRYTRS